MSNAGGKRREKRRTVEHFDGGDFAFFKSNVFGSHGEAAQNQFAATNGNRASLCF